MRSSVKVGLGLALAVVAMGAPFGAEAQTPNLVGTWKATGYAVFLGSNPYQPSGSRGANFASAPLEFTFTIKEQHENRFAGESSAAGRTEQLVGAISPDNRSGIVLDDDGQYLFTITTATHWTPATATRRRSPRSCHATPGNGRNSHALRAGGL
jgi:hypothetical protein